jgi:hypothetical protein
VGRRRCTHESSWLLQRRAPKRRDSRLDCPRRGAGVTAEVSDVPCGIRGGLDWNRAFAVSRDPFASGASDSVRRIDLVSGGKEHSSADPQN